MSIDDLGWSGANPAERLRAVTRRHADDELPIEAAGALLGFAGEPAHLVVACRRVLAHHRSSGPLWWTCARILAAPEPAAACREAQRLLAADPTVTRLSGALPVLTDDEIVAVIGWPAAVDRALGERPDVGAVAVRVPGDDTTRRVRRRAASQPVRVVSAHDLDTRSVVRVVAPALAIGPTHALVSEGVTAAVEHLAREHPLAEVWLVGGVGAVLPDRLFAAVVTATAGDAQRAPDPVEELALAAVDRIAGPRGLERPGDATARAECPVAPELLRPL